jgi:hypothetical protein
MNAKKQPPIDPFDVSLHPTRKVESMSSIAAELLLQEHDGRFEEQSGRRLRSDRSPAIDAYSDPAPVHSEPWRPVYGDTSPWQSQPWRPSIPPTTFANPPAAPRRSAALRVALLAGGALLLVFLSVTVTLLVTR